MPSSPTSKPDRADTTLPRATSIICSRRSARPRALATHSRETSHRADAHHPNGDRCRDDPGICPDFGPASLPLRPARPMVGNISWDTTVVLWSPEGTRTDQLSMSREPFNLTCSAAARIIEPFMTKMADNGQRRTVEPLTIRNAEAARDAMRRCFPTCSKTHKSSKHETNKCQIPLDLP